MNREVFVKYQGKLVKIKLKDGFGLAGKINQLYDDCFEFTTHQGTSVISFDNVAMIMEG